MSTNLDNYKHQQGGYICLNREVLRMFGGRNHSFCWIALNMVSDARWKPGNGLGKGQLFFGYEWYSNRVGVSSHTMKRFMKFAIKNGFIAERNKSAWGQVLTLGADVFWKVGDAQNDSSSDGDNRPLQGDLRVHNGDNHPPSKATIATTKSPYRPDPGTLPPPIVIEKKSNTAPPKKTDPENPQSEFPGVGLEGSSFDKEKKPKKRTKKPPTKNAEIANHFLTHYKRKMGIEYPERGPKFYGQINNWLRNVGFDEAKKYIESYFSWNNRKAKQTGFCLGTLITSLPSLAIDMKSMSISEPTEKIKYNGSGQREDMSQFMSYG